MLNGPAPKREIVLGGPLNEAPQWFTADEIYSHLYTEHRIYVPREVAHWIADGFQKAFEKGWALRDGQP